MHAWFVGMADVEGASEIAAAFAARARCHVAHSSGRPWLVGTWQPSAATVVDTGGARVALIGSCLTSATRLRREVERAADAREFNRLTCLPGSFHLAVSAPHSTRVYADVAGLCRVFHARYGGMTVIANRIAVLRDLVEAPLDEAWLAARLVYADMPAALAEATPFRGVRAVPAAHHITIGRGESIQLAPYWHAPEPVRPLAETAPELRDALGVAVENRVRGTKRASCDLSGGLDSTAVSFLAAETADQANVDLHTITAPSASPAVDDLDYAGLAAASQPQVGHSFIELGSYPNLYENLDSSPELDEPAAFARGFARGRHVARLTAKYGSRHLTGYGGDEVLLPPLAYLRDALRKTPRIALRHLRGHRALRPDLHLSFRRLATPTSSYGAWLAAQARALQEPPGSGGMPTCWELPPSLPPWVTREARVSARDLLIGVARRAEPVAPSVSQHAALSRIRALGCTMRLYADAMAVEGSHVEFPYLDEPVITTCLSTRPHERVSPWQVKPLLTEAMRGIVPDSLLARRTKAHYTSDIHRGLQHNYHQVMSLLDDCELARLGFIDSAALRVALTPPLTSDAPLAELDETLGCELWLRTLRSHGGHRPKITARDRS